MHRSFRLLVVALLLLAPLIAPAFAQDPVDPEEASLRQMYRDFDRMLVDRDVNGVVALMTRDFTFAAMDGRKSTLKEWRAAFERQLPNLVRTHTRIESVSLRSGSADVTTWSEQRYENLHLKGSDKTTFIIRSGALDHWVKMKDGWKLKSSEQKSLDIEPLD